MNDLGPLASISTTGGVCVNCHANMIVMKTHYVHQAGTATPDQHNRKVPFNRSRVFAVTV